MANDPEPLMSPAELKPLLMLAKRQPVNCAMALSKDKAGLLLLDKKGKPRKMLAALKKQAKAAKIVLDGSSLRFGTAAMNEDSGVLEFIVNKDAPGVMRVKLLEQTKKAGIGKIDIRVDDALNEEPGDDEDAEDAPAGAATAAEEADAPAATAAPASPAPTSPAPTSTATTSATTTSATNTGPAPADADAVRSRLTALVKRMMAALGANPAGADAMKTAAMAGQAALKASDLAEASAAADTLERLLDAIPPAGSAAPAAPAANGPGSPVYGKARATWVATRKRVEDELEKLHDKLQETYKGHGVVADLETVFRAKVEPMLGNLDHALSDKLDQVANTAEPAAHAKLVAEAKAIIARYEAYLANEPLIAKLDDNPFVPLSIEKTLIASLAALNKVVA